MIAWLILGCYFFILFLLVFYALHRLYLTRVVCKNHVETPQLEWQEWPLITVQLPLFNEKYVVERLINACSVFDYPSDCLEIQVLDDSTDETTEIARQKVGEYRAKGLDIKLLHRQNRHGYKAGALEAGLSVAKGEFIAIFDADFVPEPGMLKKLVQPFQDAAVGMVQARWTHLNREQSLLTRVQAIMLDAHFLIEHQGRFLSQHFFNFNGTAGMWRKATQLDAGGWQHDTLTEDLDLSYRAQLRGWRFVFVPAWTCPAELPQTVLAFKNQQHRWAKGSIQVMLKLLPGILRSKLPFRQKIEATFHLTGNLAYLLMMINTVFFMIPGLVVRRHLDWRWVLCLDGPLFLLLSCSFMFFYYKSQKLQGLSGWKTLKMLPALMSLGIGLGVNNTKAVLEALWGHPSEFVRTPKIGASMKAGYRSKRNKGLLEWFLGLVYLIAIGWACSVHYWASLPFLFLFANGFLFMARVD